MMSKPKKSEEEETKLHVGYDHDTRKARKNRSKETGIVRRRHNKKYQYMNNTTMCIVINYLRTLQNVCGNNTKNEY
jgi:hypothetical protein